MSTGATAAFGTLMKKGSTAIVEVTNIESPEISLGVEDATNMDSPSAWKEKILTLFEASDPVITINWKPAAATHIAILADFAAKTFATYNIVFTSAVAYTMSFSAAVQRFKPLGMTPAGKMSAQVTFVITGPVTFA